MGFNPYASELTLRFEGTRYTGAEVTLRADVPLREYREFVELCVGENTSHAAQWDWLREHVLLSWNLEGRDGKPLTLDAAVEELPGPLSRAVVGEWLKAVSDAGTPFGGNSASGGSSPEE
jgi:hypothetical protein